MELIRTKTLADALGLSKKALLEKARTYGWAYVEKGNQMQWVENRLPADVRFAVAAYKSGNVTPAVQLETDVDSTERSIAGDAFLNASDGMKDTARYRSALIYEYQKSGLKMPDFLSGYNQGSFPALFEKLGTVSQATFYRWIKAWKENGASGITPKYGTKRGGAGESLLDEEREFLKYFWLKNTKPTAMHAYRLMKANLPYSTCSYQTALRYLNSIPRMIAGYAREGAGRFENMFLPYMEQDMTRYKSLDVAVSDHHCVDCIVVYKGQKIRPWLTTFQDLRSGKILGWCPCVKPSSLSIMAAYYMCCIKYGIPKSLLFDNGKDYRGKWLNGHKETVRTYTPEGLTEETEIEFKGTFPMIGSEVHFTRTYNGKSKARQERYFRILGEYLAKDIGSYTGSDSRTRPDDAALMFRSINGMEMRGELPSFSDFVSACSSMIEYINDSFECATNGGKTRSQTFMENLPPPEQIRHPTKELLQTALCKGEVRRVGRNGVKVGGTNFWGAELSAYIGQDVRVYTSLATPLEVTCCTAAGALICTAKADYFKETGNIAADTERLSSARKKLTLLAETGSNEVKASPEHETMIEVAASIYGGNSLNQVDKFLSFDEEDSSEKVAAGAENLPQKNKTKLINPLSADSSVYARDNVQ